MVRVEFRPLAALKRLLPEGDREKGKTTLMVAPGTTADALMGLAGIDRGRALMVLVNGRYAAPGRALADGDVVSVFPPVAGG